ncbi:DUF6314 family protein [Anianabacter salinae]|uniref:DUF6314 family protein n=1 Tax=Anianabacter salinae TaxID=2851023 RepID=UPI00225E4B6D|nr:DUF6314 family protein [Anianabacter salinae]MBV0912916.1 trigger factor [Anianabacter salinae]
MERPNIDAFAGDWALSRRIEDARAGETLTFAGTAQFVPDAAGFTYIEDGLLQAPDRPAMRAQRRYLWRQGAAGIEVYFADGRFFHLIGAGPSPAAEHDCAPDVYRVRYDFIGWPDWRAEWRVTGPHKDYVLRSEYRRA